MSGLPSFYCIASAFGMQDKDLPSVDDALGSLRQLYDVKEPAHLRHANGTREFVVEGCCYSENQIQKAAVRLNKYAHL